MKHGKEIRMPEGLTFTDKDGTVRSEIRIKWWEDPSQSTYRKMSVVPMENLPDKPIDVSLLNNSNYYTPLEKSVFFGHYWVSGQPKIIRENICCLDYSVAKNGILVAYRFDGERELTNEKFVFA
jgi:hypothetical protein